MPEIKLTIDDLILDHENPRISHAEGQQEALQKIVKNPKAGRAKLVTLARSIVEHGLNPMDRMLVLRVGGSNPPRFISLEGNRRVAALKLLSNPAVMSGLEMPNGMRRTLEDLARDFFTGNVEPIAGFELPSRQEGDYWLKLRHRGEQGGAGIVDWDSTAQQRFRDRSPAIQALDLVTERGGLTPEERARVEDRFPLTTLQRIVEDREVRKAIGLDVKKGKLVTSLPAPEVLKPLKRIVLDLATKERRVGSLMKTAQMLDYVRGFGKADKPDLSQIGSAERTVDEIPVSEFTPAKTPRPRRRPDPSDRKEVVPKGCPIHVTDNRIAEIYRELRTLKLTDARNAIAVLLRVFLEMSVDHFLETHGGSVSIQTGGGQKFKKLDKKLAEVVATLVSMNVPMAHFAAITRSLSVPNSPMNIDLFHLYVHDRFATPSPGELTAAWDQAQPLFEKIWP
jgi:hypothetical protein